MSAGAIAHVGNIAGCSGQVGIFVLSSMVLYSGSSAAPVTMPARSSLALAHRSAAALSHAGAGIADWHVLGRSWEKA